MVILLWSALPYWDRKANSHLGARLDGVEHSSHCTCILVLVSKVRKHVTPACGCGVQERDIRIELEFSCKFIPTRFFNPEWQKEVMNQNISCPLCSNCMKQKKKNRNLSIRKMGNLLPLKPLELLMTYKAAIRLYSCYYSMHPASLYGGWIVSNLMSTFPTCL